MRPPTRVEPRGIRNHNPGNIRKSKDKWQGLAPIQSDPDFFQFTDATYGVRAIARTLITYQDKYELDTVRKLIERWAPPVENDTGSYVSHVADHLGVHPDDHIDVHQYEYLLAMTEAIIRHENGRQPYSSAVLSKAMVMAGVEPETRKSLASSRTAIGTASAGSGTAIATVTESVKDVADTASTSLPLIKFLVNTMPYVAMAMVLAGLGLILYARWDDRRKGLR